MQVSLPVGHTVGVATATVGGSSRPVALRYGKRCVDILRSDVGKNVVFQVSGRRLQYVDSESIASTPMLIKAATKPTVKVAQSGIYISATVTVAARHSAGIVTAKIGTKSPVVVRKVGTKYPLRITPADIGKKVVFSTYATQSGMYPSLTAVSAPFTIRR